MQGWATWANLVTLVRLALIPASVLAIAFDDFNLATVLFVIIQSGHATRGPAGSRLRRDICRHRHRRLCPGGLHQPLPKLADPTRLCAIYVGLQSPKRSDLTRFPPWAS